MKTLYLECLMGAAGDMLMGALSELTDQKAFIEQINQAGIPGVEVKAVSSEKCGIHGTHMEVTVHGEEEISEDVDEHHHHPDHHAHDHDESHEHHHHYHPGDINQIIDGLAVSEKVKEDAKAVYHLIAEAESKAHQMPVEEVHFHEVGAMDAVADVVGCCMLFEQIHADRICCSTVSLGSGMVKCAHGILPVPAPATANLIQGMKTAGGPENGELLTPTGAALLKYFVKDFNSMPAMQIEKIGYGMGNKDFERANCVRAFVGESDDDGEVCELTANLDDMSSEDIGFAMEQLFKAGALDVYLTPVQMKKNRPGILFTCMCRTDDREKMVQLMFRYLSTLGIRDYRSRRYSLQRHIETLDTAYGSVRCKISEGYGTMKKKLEFEDLAAIAEKVSKSTSEIRKEIETEKK